MSQVQIKEFVRKVLGCTCPDAVFETIVHDRSATDAARPRRIAIGGRLLVLLLDADEQQHLDEAVVAALRGGVAERDAAGMNRVRLVVFGRQPDAWRRQVETAFAASPLCDDKTHVHAVSKAEVASLFQ